MKKQDRATLKELLTGTKPFAIIQYYEYLTIYKDLKEKEGFRIYELLTIEESKTQGRYIVSCITLNQAEIQLFLNNLDKLEKVVNNGSGSVYEMNGFKKEFEAKGISPMNVY